jgi:hypothetical protein
MLKHVAVTLIAIASYIIVQWLFWSFVTWDFSWWDNIPEWHSIVRFYGLIIYLMGMVGSAAFANLLIQD